MPQSNQFPVELPSGRTIKIETAQRGGEQAVSGNDIIPFDEVSETVEEIAGSFQNVLERISPDKATIEFGLELGVESGKLTALIVKGTGKANLSVKLEWSKDTT